MMEFGFLLKKLITFWLMPLSLCVILLGSGLMLLWLNKHIRLAKYLLSAGAFCLVLFSWQPVSYLLLSPVENSHPRFNGSPVKYVVVLGNEVISDGRLTPLDQLSSSARSRLLEGIRIAQSQPDSQLIVSGYGSKNKQSCAEVYSLAAQSLGFDKNRIIELREPKDTHEEAVFVKRLVGDAPTAVVTSASHMDRAIHEFKTERVNAIAAPTFYLAKNKPYFEWRFNAEGLYQSERAFHERIGQLWQAIVR